MTLSISEIVNEFRPDLAGYEVLYQHFHSQPELSFQEYETAAKINDELKQYDLFHIQKAIGRTGIAATLENGAGPVVLLRADIDALPVEEKTGLKYASKKRMQNLDGVEKPVMHVRTHPTVMGAFGSAYADPSQACGHDMHITSLLAAAELLIKAREHWTGTLILCFQPAEEKGAGARAMVDDGLYLKVPVPDVVLGGHVMPFRAGYIGTKRGLMASAADSFEVTLHGRGGHGSQPHRTVDPVVMAAHTIVRLQDIVSRETDPADAAVVTVGSIHAGDAENIIASRADLKLNIRTITPETRKRVIRSLKRIIDAEAEASNAPAAPEITATSAYPFLVNDDDVTARLEHSFAAHFTPGPRAYDNAAIRLGGSEDFGVLATSVNRPSCFWTYGGTDPEVWDKAEVEGKLTESIPINHSAHFAPVVQPTLKIACDAYAVAALSWLKKE